MSESDGRDTSTHPLDLQRWAPAGDPVLEVLKPEPRRIVIAVGSTTLGRDLGRDGVHFDVPGVSREHAQVTRAEGRATSIMDLGSKNGTFVNGKRTEVQTLREGDRIGLGPHVEMRFVHLVDAARPMVLTPREQEVASMVAGGLTNKAIAERLGVTPHAVDAVLRSAYRRVGVASRAALAAWFAKAT
ncbi:MAG: FHA domain-containing protein [Myxococcota bacterium]